MVGKLWVLIKNLSDFGGQVLFGKGFLDKVYPLVEHAVMSDDIGGIAGHEQPFEVWADEIESVSQFLAVHTGHDDIGHQ